MSGRNTLQACRKWACRERWWSLQQGGTDKGYKVRANRPLSAAEDHTVGACAVSRIGGKIPVNSSRVRKLWAEKERKEEDR